MSVSLETLSKGHVLGGMSEGACPEVWVIDATALLFRAYYGMPPRLSPAGEHVGAVLGLGHLLRGLLRRAPERVVLHEASSRQRVEAMSLAGAIRVFRWEGG